MCMTGFDSPVQPHFNYCSVVWGNCGSGLSEKLQKLHNRAARILMYASYDSNIDELFRELGTQISKIGICCCYDVQIFTWDDPEYLTSRFVVRNDITSYRLRNTENKLALPKPLLLEKDLLLEK